MPSTTYGPSRIPKAAPPAFPFTLLHACPSPRPSACAHRANDALPFDHRRRGRSHPTLRSSFSPLGFHQRAAERPLDESRSKSQRAGSARDAARLVTAPPRRTATALRESRRRRAPGAAVPARAPAATPVGADDPARASAIDRKSDRSDGAKRTGLVGDCPKRAQAFAGPRPRSASRVAGSAALARRGKPARTAQTARATQGVFHASTRPGSAAPKDGTAKTKPPGAERPRRARVCASRPERSRALAGTNDENAGAGGAGGGEGNGAVQRWEVARPRPSNALESARLNIVLTWKRVVSARYGAWSFPSARVRGLAAPPERAEPRAVGGDRPGVVQTRGPGL